MTQKDPQDYLFRDVDLELLAHPAVAKVMRERHPNRYKYRLRIHWGYPLKALEVADLIARRVKCEFWEAEAMGCLENDPIWFASLIQSVHRANTEPGGGMPKLLGLFLQWRMYGHPGGVYSVDPIPRPGKWQEVEALFREKSQVWFAEGVIRRLYYRERDRRLEFYRLWAPCRIAYFRTKYNLRPAARLVRSHLWDKTRV